MAETVGCIYVVLIKHSTGVVSVGDFGEVILPSQPAVGHTFAVFGDVFRILEIHRQERKLCVLLIVEKRVAGSEDLGDWPGEF